MSVSVLESILQQPPLDHEWSLKHLDQRLPKHVITGTGIAEIKPHKADKIRLGLSQLRNYLYAERTAGRPVGSAWLVTYMPWTGPGGCPPGTRGQCLRVIAHEIWRYRLLPRSSTAAYKSAPLPSLEAVIKSRRVLPPLRLPARLPSTAPFPTWARPDELGHAVEDPIRQHFRQSFKIHTLKWPRSRADIRWELAQFYGELARATGDAYWREVADELVTSGA